MLRAPPFVRVKARRVKQEQTNIFVLSGMGASTGLLFLLKALGAKGVLSMFYKSLDDSLKLQQEM